MVGIFLNFMFLSNVIAFKDMWIRMAKHNRIEKGREREKKNGIKSIWFLLVLENGPSGTYWFHRQLFSIALFGNNFNLKMKFSVFSNTFCIHIQYRQNDNHFQYKWKKDPLARYIAIVSMTSSDILHSNVSGFFFLLLCWKLEEKNSKLVFKLINL